MIPWWWLLVSVLVSSSAGLLVWAVAERLLGPHVHSPRSWDGYFEHCRCGACSGDVRDENEFRCISFDEWPEDAR